MGDVVLVDTTGPTLRGARHRTLQEGPRCCWTRLLRDPHCEERPGAAHSRRVHLRCGLIGHPSPITGPTLRGAVKRRTLQAGLRSITGRSGDTLVFGTWPVSLGTLRRYRAVGVRSLRGLGSRRSGRFCDTFHLGWLLTTGRSDDTLVSVTGRSLAHVIWPVSLGTLRRYLARVCGIYVGRSGWVADGRDNRSGRDVPEVGCSTPLGRLWDALAIPGSVCLVVTYIWLVGHVRDASAIPCNRCRSSRACRWAARLGRFGDTIRRVGMGNYTDGTLWRHQVCELARVLHTVVGRYHSGRFAIPCGGPGSGQFAKGWDVSATPTGTMVLDPRRSRCGVLGHCGVYGARVTVVTCIWLVGYVRDTPAIPATGVAKS